MALTTNSITLAIAPASNTSAAIVAFLASVHAHHHRAAQWKVEVACNHCGAQKLEVHRNTVNRSIDEKDEENVRPVVTLYYDDLARDMYSNNQTLKAGKLVENSDGTCAFFEELRAHVDD